MGYQNTYYLLLDATLADVGHVLRKVDGAALRRLRKMIRTAPRVVVLGEGGVGVVMQMFVHHLMSLNLQAAVAQPESEPALAEGDLLLIGSAAGRETALGQHAAQARDVKARVALITGAAQSLIMQHAHHAVVLNLPPHAEPELFMQVLFMLLEIQRLQLIEELHT